MPYTELRCRSNVSPAPGLIRNRILHKSVNNAIKKVLWCPSGDWSTGPCGRLPREYEQIWKSFILSAAPVERLWLFGKEVGVMPFAKGFIYPAKARDGREILPTLMIQKILKVRIFRSVLKCMPYSRQIWRLLSPSAMTPRRMSLHIHMSGYTRSLHLFRFLNKWENVSGCYTFNPPSASLLNRRL